jgi:lysophospholipase L1-like esterase
MVRAATPQASKGRHDSLPDELRASMPTGSPAPPAQTKMRSLMLAPLVFTASVIVSVLLLELCLTVAGIGEEEYLKRDPVMGWVMVPGKKMTWRKEGFAHLEINSAGMLDREYPTAKSPDTLRIAVIGDSNIESLQVPRELNFCHLVEDKLRNDFASSGKNVEVLNFGISAYNVGQLYLRLKNLATKYNPDIVIISEYVDSTRNLSPDGTGFFHARPNFSLKGKNLVCDYSKQDEWQATDEGRRMQSTSWLRENSRIWGVVSIAAEQVQKWLDGFGKGESQWGTELTDKKTTFDATSGPPSAFGVFIEPEKNSWPELPSVNLPHKQAALRKWWPVHAALLKEMKHECDSINAKMILLRLPQVNGYNNIAETELLKDFATNSSVPFIDATDSFIQSASKHEPLFYGPHMSPRGHALLAKQVVTELPPMLKRAESTP